MANAFDDLLRDLQRDYARSDDASRVCWGLRLPARARTCSCASASSSGNTASSSESATSVSIRPNGTCAVPCARAEQSLTLLPAPARLGRLPTIAGEPLALHELNRAHFGASPEIDANIDRFKDAVERIAPLASLAPLRSSGPRLPRLTRPSWPLVHDGPASPGRCVARRR